MVNLELSFNSDEILELFHNIVYAPTEMIEPEEMLYAMLFFIVDQEVLRHTHCVG